MPTWARAEAQVRAGGRPGRRRRRAPTSPALLGSVRPSPHRGARMIETARSADGTAIAYERTGSGPPLVLVGGAFSDRKGASYLTPSLAGACTVVTFDRRGRGESGD